MRNPDWANEARRLYLRRADSGDLNAVLKLVEIADNTGDFKLAAEAYDLAKANSRGRNAVVDAAKELFDRLTPRRYSNMPDRRRNPREDRATLVRSAALGNKQAFTRLVESLGGVRPETSAWHLVIREWVRLGMLEPFVEFMRTRQKKKLWLARLVKSGLVPFEWIDPVLIELDLSRFIGHFSGETPYLDFDYDQMLVFVSPGGAPTHFEAAWVQSSDPQEDARLDRSGMWRSPQHYEVYSFSLDPADLAYYVNPGLLSYTGRDEMEVQDALTNNDPMGLAWIAFDIISYGGPHVLDDPAYVPLKQLHERYALEIVIADEWRKRGRLGGPPRA